MTIEKWFPAAEFPVSQEVFDRLPRHAGYRYDYSRGVAYVTPEPRQFHGVLALSPRSVPAEIDAGLAKVTVAKATGVNWSELGRPFERALCAATPLGQVPEQASADAARTSLDGVRGGVSGLIVHEACFAARGALPRHSEAVLGGLLVTLLPRGDLEDFSDPAWTQPPPPDAIAAGWGRPHLSWVFVDPWIGRRGVASAMLVHAVNALVELGYDELASTFLLGNESSTLWHWRNGFRLCSEVLSPRALKRTIEQRNRQIRGEIV